MSEYAVTDPASGEILRWYPTATEEQIETAVTAAAAAARGWARTTGVAQRAALVRRVGTLHTERRGPLGAIIVREMGSPWTRHWRKWTSPRPSTATTPITQKNSWPTSRWICSTVRAPR
jgi:acyl-CoA reductase-like NAD-dependent aldehyde dehydrogenase